MKQYSANKFASCLNHRPTSRLSLAEPLQHHCTIRNVSSRADAILAAYLREAIDPVMLAAGIAERARRGEPVTVPASALLALLDSPSPDLLRDLCVCAGVRVQRRGRRIVISSEIAPGLTFSL